MFCFWFFAFFFFCFLLILPHLLYIIHLSILPIFLPLTVLVTVVIFLSIPHLVKVIITYCCYCYVPQISQKLGWRNGLECLTQNNENLSVKKMCNKEALIKQYWNQAHKTLHQTFARTYRGHILLRDTKDSRKSVSMNHFPSGFRPSFWTCHTNTTGVHMALALFIAAVYTIARNIQ